MVVNIYLTKSGDLIDIQADESTQHQLGDIINLNDKQMTVTNVTTKEEFDYSTIVHVNRLEEKEHSVTDVAGHKLRGDYLNE